MGRDGYAVDGQEGFSFLRCVYGRPDILWTQEVLLSTFISLPIFSSNFTAFHLLSFPFIYFPCPFIYIRVLSPTFISFHLLSRPFTDIHFLSPTFASFHLLSRLSICLFFLSPIFAYFHLLSRLSQTFTSFRLVFSPTFSYFHLHSHPFSYFRVWPFNAVTFNESLPFPFFSSSKDVSLLPPPLFRSLP